MKNCKLLFVVNQINTYIYSKYVHFARSSQREQILMINMDFVIFERTHSHTAI
jgi:hypothetical protein